MDKKGIIFFVGILVIVLILVGCGKEDVATDERQNVKETEKKEKKVEEDKNEKEEKIDNSKKEKEENNDKDVKIGIPSPLSGLYAKEEKVNRRPVAVMIDNHPRARWQAGISQAEIVYEFPVEGTYTRYMAIFLINDPSHIGPIRSSRPYFVSSLLEYDPVYVRVGGSEAAKRDVRNLNVADIDGLSSSKAVFKRYYKTNKKAPNNMYSTMDIIRKTQKERGYKLTGDYKGFKFYDKDTDIVGNSAKDVVIRYNKDNTTEYKYDNKEKIYKRYKDGKLHIDELDNKTLKVKNILIQKAKTTVIDSEGRLAIDIIGSGKGKYITNGSIVDITWKKKTRRSKTIYYDKEGTELKLNPGITWIQVLPNNGQIEIKK
ncbi:DUF3048 domain-containing protein [Dethiothermospora halolimnae]|uniref:DUF3048 domain-containing protein n=1 Tax=Dethiothermospora halolimnae TaxID=3114390 RepID=UPI003CCB89FE